MSSNSCNMTKQHTALRMNSLYCAIKVVIIMITIRLFYCLKYIGQMLKSFYTELLSTTPQGWQKFHEGESLIHINKSDMKNMTN